MDGETNIQKFDDDDFLAGMFLGSMLGHHGGGGRGSTGCCGPGCAVMMLTLPFVMILGFVRERKEKKAETDQASQENTKKGTERASRKVQAEHTEK
jgi:hypothetical protein